jgi:excisionase family DNA binding protein
MRAYYRKHKNQWRKYNRDALARMSESEREAQREKRRAYHRVHYLQNRDEIIARTARYQKEHAEWFAAYRAEWYQSNKAKVNARRLRHYHSVVKHRDRAVKQESPFVSISEAVTELGAKLRAFRQWVYEGRIPAVKSPGGRYLIHRDEVERIRRASPHLPREIQKQLGLNRKGVK